MSASSDYFSDNETERSNTHEVNEEVTNELDFEILHPEHPLMIKFQETLKKSLTCKIEKLELENNELENEIKNLKHETDILSETFYNQKKEVEKLQKTTEKCSESVSNLITERQREEKELNRLREEYDKELAELKQIEKENDEWRAKLEAQSNWLYQLRQYEQKQASSLAVASLMISKAKSDLKNTLTEKEKQDYLLMKLEHEVFKETMEIQTYRKQIKDACAELANLQEQLIQKEAEFQLEKGDNERLSDLWKEVVDIVSKRDQRCSELKKQLEEAEIERKSLLAEIRNYERDAEREMLKGELLLQIQNRREETLRAARRTFHDLTQQIKEKEEELAKLDDMIECTETNLKHATEELQEQERELTVLDKMVKKLTAEKYKLEESVLMRIQDEMISNKEASKLYKELDEIRKEIEQKEAHLHDLKEKRLAVGQNLEIKQKELETSKTFVEEKRAVIKKLGEELQKNEAKLEHTKLQVKQQNCILDQKRKELKSLQEKPVPCELEERIKQVEEDIKEVTENIEQKKKEWMRKQNEIMLLSEKKSQCINELNEIRKDISTFQQSVRQQEEKISKAEQEGKQIDKTTEYLLHKLSKINSQYYEQKCLVEALNSDNFVSQTEVLGKLKECEKETIATQEEIEELEKTKKALNEKLLQLQREDLEWEKKIKMITEVKRNMMQDQSENGDIGAMKNEIHRMEIRYAQLKKAQDSLATDLEKCVAKRDNIVDKTIVEETNKNNEAQAEHALARKIRITESDVAKLQKKLKEQEERNQALEKEKQRFADQMKQAEMKIEELESTNLQLDEEIQKATLEKHKNLQVLIRKQKYADFLHSVKSGKVKSSNQSEEVIEKNYLKQKSLNADLCSVLESVSNEFPHLKNEIIPILNIAQSTSQ